MSSGCGDVLSLADLQTAKKHQIFEAEVITGKSGGVAGGADIDYATNPATRQTQKTLPAVLRDAGFSPVSWDFSTGGTLTVNDRDKVVYDPVSKTWYSYAGTLPVTVPAGFNPVGNADWKPQTDPDLRNELASPSGSGMIGSPTGTVESRLLAVENDVSAIENTTAHNFVTTKIPCANPTVGNGVKAVVKLSSSSDFYVISAKALGKKGYIATRVTSDVAASDAQNYGGASNMRMGSVDNIRQAITAKLTPYAKSGAMLSTLTASQIAILHGFTSTGSSISANTSAGDYSLASPQVYSVSTSGFVDYQLSTSDTCTVRLGCSNGASATVNIKVSRDGVNWMLRHTFTTQLPPAGGGPLPIDIEVEGLSGTWYVRVENTGTNPMYLVGLNFDNLGGDNIRDYDNFIASLEPDTADGVSYYLGGLGANEFAAKELSTGKFFGTYHGGHSNFLQRLRTDSASFNLDSSTAPVLLLTKTALLHSASTLTVQSTTYSYVASTKFGDGVSICDYAIHLQSGEPVVCERVFTHMCTSARNFNWIHLPVLVNKSDDGDVEVGQCGAIQQFRSGDTAYINTYFTQVNVAENGFSGAYVSFQPNYNKQYYGPVLASVDGYPLVEGSFTTCKEFF